MDISEAIPAVLKIVGGAQPSTVAAVLHTIDKQIRWQHHLIDADVARTNPRALSLDALVAQQPHPHADLTMVAVAMLSASLSTFLHRQSKGLHMLPAAERMLRCKRNLADMRLQVNIAIAKLGVPGCTWLTSSPHSCALPDAPRKDLHPPLASSLPPVAGACAAPYPSSLPGLPSPPPTTTTAFSAPVSQLDPTAVQAGRRRKPVKVTALPLHVLVRVLESIDSLAAIDSFIAALPKAAKARSRVRTLALTDGASVASWALCIEFEKLRVLTINAPLRRDSMFNPPLALSAVTLNQSGSGIWTAQSTRHAVAALGLATVRAVVIEDANAAALELLVRTSAIGFLRCIFGGDTVDIAFTTVNGMTRTFTRLRLEGLSIPLVYRSTITPHLTHLTLSNWLPQEWIRMLSQSAPVSLESLEVVLSATPPVAGPGVDVRPLLDYRGSEWAGCDRLHTLTLSSAAAPIEIDVADIRAFMSAAFSRLVDVEMRDVLVVCF